MVTGIEKGNEALIVTIILIEMGQENSFLFLVIRWTWTEIISVGTVKSHYIDTLQSGLFEIENLMKKVSST